MKRHLLILFTISAVLSLLFPFYSKKVEAKSGQASIYLSPSQGAFAVGATFDISVFVNTGEHDINAVGLDLKFPPDKLQIVNPTAGNSFISIWIDQPKFSNTKGTVSLKGGLPNPGINTSAGLITTITFRAKITGNATVSVMESSQVLANDGKGTDLLTSHGQGIYNLFIPPPEGPVIVSISHGDRNRWYKNNNCIFSWSLQDPTITYADYM